MRKALRTMQISMRNNALAKFTRIDIRTLRMLQNLDLFKGKAEPIGNEVDLSVLLNPQHPRREKLPPGPLVLYASDEEKPKRILLDLPVLLFSEKVGVRRAALKCFDQMNQGDVLACTPKTAKILEDAHPGLVSRNPERWRIAAVAMFDALNDDALLSMHGVRQCLACEPVISDNLSSYATKVLHPTISSMDSINVGITKPEKEHELIAKIVDQVVAKAQNLAEVCAGYYERLGHLPLAPRYAMAEAVQRWLGTHPGADTWIEVWNWAHAAFGPVPKYHACCVFALHPELVPQGKLPRLWKEFLTVISEPCRKKAEELVSEAWALRHDLALHFAFHLEANLPDGSGESIACFAWWFSEQVARLFPDIPAAIKFYRENWVQPTLDVSSHAWLAASPHIERSFLRYVTLSAPSPWAVGLLAVMGAELERLTPAELPEEFREQFYEALIFHIISNLPLPTEIPNDPTYSPECPLAQTVLKWAQYQPDEQRRALEELVAMSQGLGTNDGLCKALRELGERSLADQVAVAAALKAKAYTDPAIAEGVWEILSDAQWRQEVLENVDERVLGLLVEAFSLFQVNSGGNWGVFLPHYIADLCGKTNDEERRRQLFLYVLHTSLASDTVSAVRRLLRGDHKAKYVELAQGYRARVEAMRAQYPPWVAGKLRGLIANLHVV